MMKAFKSVFCAFSIFLHIKWRKKNIFISFFIIEKLFNLLSVPKQTTVAQAEDAVINSLLWHHIPSFIKNKMQKYMQ